MTVDYERCEVLVVGPAVRPRVSVGFVIEEPCFSSVFLVGIRTIVIEAMMISPIWICNRINC